MPLRANRPGRNFSRLAGATVPLPRNSLAAVLLLVCLAGCGPAPLPTPKPQGPSELPKKSAQDVPDVDARLFAGIDSIAEQEIRSGHMPGGVVLVGHNGRIAYRKAFGNRCVEPRPEPMLLDTVFDIASLTKVVATTMAIMQLAERGRLRLDDPVAAYCLNSPRTTRV